MPASKNVNNINSRFMQEMFMDSVNIPNKLLREHEQMGLNERELVVLLRLLHLYYTYNGFNIGDVAAEFSLNEDEAAALVSPLIAKDILLPLEDGREAYSLDGLFVQLYELWVIDKRRMQKGATKAKPGKAETPKRNTSELGHLYRLFERELGRNLSPIENDKITQWLEVDKQSPELILEALSRAVLHGKATFAYIDKILFNWQQKNLRTTAEVKTGDVPLFKKTAKKQPLERVKDTWLE